MKNKLFATAALAAFIVGAGAVVVAHADDTGTDISNDPAKIAAMESTPSPTDISGDQVSDTATLAPAATNQSNSFQLNLLDQQQAIIDMMTGTVAPGRLDKSLVGRDQQTQLDGALSDAAIAARRQVIAYNYTASQVDAQLATYNQGLRDAITHPESDWVYTDNRFSVTTWQGIQWTNNNGRAMVIGHQSYQESDGTWEDEPDSQWTLSFSHADKEGHYHFSTFKAIKSQGDQG